MRLARKIRMVSLARVGCLALKLGECGTEVG